VRVRRVRGELYVSEIMRRDMEGAGAMPERSCEGEVEADG
jgi:hypothetical protein